MLPTFLVTVGKRLPE